MYFHVLPIMEKYYWYVFIESQGMAAESIQWRNIEKKEKLGRVAHCFNMLLTVLTLLGSLSTS